MVRLSPAPAPRSSRYCEKAGAVTAPLKSTKSATASHDGHGLEHIDAHTARLAVAAAVGVRDVELGDVVGIGAVAGQIGLLRRPQRADEALGLRRPRFFHDLEVLRYGHRRQDTD